MKSIQSKDIILTWNGPLDNDDRWIPVPDDPPSRARGVVPLNSNRIRGIDQEFEDPVNFMRRDTGNQGCRGYLTLGVTYDTPYPPNAPGVPADYHSPRQTITVSLRWNWTKSRYVRMIAKQRPTLRSVIWLSGPQSCDLARYLFCSGET